MNFIKYLSKNFYSALILLLFYNLSKSSINAQVIEGTQFSSSDFDGALESGRSYHENEDRILKMLKDRGLLAGRGSYENYHQKVVPDRQGWAMTRNASLILHVTTEMAKKRNLKPTQFNLRTTPLRTMCPTIPVCTEPSKYRSVDGSCNNLKRTYWGKSMTAFERLLAPNYSDGMQAIRVSIDGSPLPSARVISQSLAPDRNNPHKIYTLMVMVFGQFVDHDLDLTAMTSSPEGSTIRCCNSSVLHPQCLSITIPENDPFFSRFGQRCMNFVRSAPALRSDCHWSARLQRNSITSYLDLSSIYGSILEQSRTVRAFTGGRLRVTEERNANSEQLLLVDTNRTNQCFIPRDSQSQCFFSGDIRVNEHSELTVMQTLWVREHNRVAGILSKLNPKWNDETIYQESRRIVVAEFQHIIYNEFLPIILGPDYISKYRLKPNPVGHSKGYSEEINAGITSEFASAAYRLHSLVEGNLKLMDENKRIIRNLQLRTQFHNPIAIYEEDTIELMINGMSGQPTQNGDRFFSVDISNFLFRPNGQEFGLDLVSINIQRGRDNGLPTYNQMRKFCGFKPIRDFNDLKTIMSAEASEAMRRTYRSVDDIDLYIAGVSERQVRGGLVGPTFACIIAEQFQRLKNGDRFWLENGGLETSLTKSQLLAIKRTNFARILCDNSNIKTMQSNPFNLPGDFNQKIDCRDLNQAYSFSFQDWKEADQAGGFMNDNSRRGNSRRGNSKRRNSRRGNSKRGNLKNGNLKKGYLQGDYFRPGYSERDYFRSDY